ncbi:thiopurine S-methyltransferase [Pseudomonas neustonica]|uniref:Thiopurine S-methyltransferase n=1 Tax=Pseudomonas neustonica TaxID=2487346 RepID=A0ABX9XHD3_9PSED|nr:MULTISPECIES: thiopurine S-methyltransferase [Pseudomonas]MAB25438.1 thiopurine S-methyltransferase [Pseudomonadales bacterium]ROZ82424.1 thiopurine S-methyltransferase [Pseudomonas sp. SSM44]ROZ84328.1 thiopurine S-methyltransferase [Pseudomonas neustonica]|tara:strand:+ start:26074 stop:26724 length:651 start_codon:yes stop_codon:yes gene_type:complete
MEAEFWQTRWQRGETGFHKSRINPLLSRWWPALQVRPSARVWVPLCGKSLDMLWLRDQGYEVQGVELARTAIESFISEQKLALTWQQQDEFDVAIGAGFELLCGDFFKLTAEQMKDITAVYDRAALIALPPDMRRAYVAHTRAILPPGWQMLLVTLDYPQQQRPGPPFSVPDDEVHSLFAGCRIELFDEQDVLADHAVFAAQGMDQLVERVYRIQN